MKIHGDRFQIGHGARDEKDQRLEPEEQPVRRILETSGTVNVGTPEQGAPVGLSVPASVSAEMSAEDMEAVLATQCQFCANWDQAAWAKERHTINPIDLDRMRAQALDCAAGTVLTEQQKQSADPLLDCMGKCQALTELLGDDMYAHPQASCPEATPDGHALPILFRPRDGAKKLRAHVRDRIMRAAQGRGLTS